MISTLWIYKHPTIVGARYLAASKEGALVLYQVVFLASLPHLLIGVCLFVCLFVYATMNRSSNQIVEVEVAWKQNNILSTSGFVWQDNKLAEVECYQNLRDTHRLKSLKQRHQNPNHTSQASTSKICQLS